MFGGRVVYGLGEGYGRVDVVVVDVGGGRKGAQCLAALPESERPPMVTLQWVTQCIAEEQLLAFTGYEATGEY